MFMAYTPEQVIEVKRQIFNQTKDLPEDQRKAIEEQVNAMAPEQLEEFVKQQMQQGGQAGGGGSQKGIFRMIVDGDVPSKKVDENKEVIAVVSKRAVSKGHVLVIPKKVVSDVKGLPSSAFTLAKKIAKKLSSKMKAKDVEIQTANVFGETVIDVMPVYDKAINKGEAYEASEEEMEEVYSKLRVVEKPKVIKIKKVKSQGKPIKLKRRIP